jgi:hypothetical protein
MGETMIEPSSDDARVAAPAKGRTRRTALLAAGVTAAAGAVMVLTAVGTTSSAGAAPLPQITICHATPPGTAADGWTPVVVNEASIIHGRNHATHRLDIIPAFDYFDNGNRTYPGKNLDKVLRNGHTGADILANECVVPPRESPTITICHATPPETAARGWTAVTVTEASVRFGKNHGAHRLDIIPAFTFQNTDYPGKNLDKVLRNGHTGEEILANGCVVPPRDSPSITICHALPPDTAERGWTAVTVTEASVRFGHNHGAHALDIIPAFTFQSTDYPGKNLDTVFAGFTGAQILENGCTFPTVTPPPTTSTTATTATQVVTQGPIPVGVNAGLHNPVQNAGLKSWGILLLLLGGAAGLILGLWPSRRRAH